LDSGRKTLQGNVNNSKCVSCIIRSLFPEHITNVVYGSNAKVFKINEKDTLYVDFDQNLGILPNPKVKLQGNRGLYEFDKKVDVFERG
jgi:hypothetical protein